MQHQGYIPSSNAELDTLYGALKNDNGSGIFADFMPPLAGSGAGKCSLPIKSVHKFDPGAFTEAQTTGDCTSHGTRNAIDISRAVEIDIKGETEGFVARTATEPIYGMRGFSGQGMSPAMAGEFVHGHGFMLRKDYGFVDLSKYNASIGSSWGGKGCPEEVKAECKKHPCRYLARVNNVEEARDALANGYGLFCGSGHGFSNKRDENGIAAKSGGWNHCMAWGGCDDTRTVLDEMLFYIIQSWGKWNSGPHGKWGELSIGGFWVRQKDAEAMIRTGELWAVGNVDGFPPQKLPDYSSYWGA